MPGVRAWTRDLYKNIGGGPSAETVTLSPQARHELTFLRSHIRHWGPVGTPIFSGETDIEVFTDAGDFGCGGHTCDMEWSEPLPDHLIGTSSTHRELFALLRFAQENASLLRNRRVKFRMDSAAAVRNLYNQGGKIPDLIAIHKLWMDLCTLHNITATYVWLPREQNDRADELSKRTHLSWALDTTAAASINHALGSSLPPYIPDLNRISTTLDEVTRSGKPLLLVHPVWRGATWWVRLQGMTSRHTDLPDAPEMLRPRNPSPEEPVHIPAWKMRASLISAARAT